MTSCRSATVGIPTGATALEVEVPDGFEGLPEEDVAMVATEGFCEEMFAPDNIAHEVNHGYTTPMLFKTIIKDKTVRPVAQG